MVKLKVSNLSLLVRFQYPAPNTGAMPMSDNPSTDMHTLAKNNLRGQAEQINLYAIREYGLSSIVRKTQGLLFRDRRHC